ncbi:MAG: hypothetical protein ACHRXM_26710 [Isosphaerales bacterium]
MNARERPHYVIKPSEIAKWLDREPETWWMVDGDPLLTGKLDFPCPSGELSEALRRYQRDLVIYPVMPTSTGSQPAGQAIKWQSLNDLADRDNPQKRRTFLLSWSDREDEWLLSEYPSSKLPELEH